jgi:hypothetical protein
MKRNWYAAYDYIRQGKFKTPEKILLTEKLLETNQAVINWWCRQSGKSLTSIKIARDLLVNNPGSFVVFISVSASSSKIVHSLVSRTIDRDLVSKDTSEGIFLKNGSKFVTGTLKTGGSVDNLLKEVDLMIVDEFEYIQGPIFANFVLSMRKKLHPTLLERFFNMFKRGKNTKFILASSKKDGGNFEMLKTIPGIPISYMNWELVPSVNKVKMIELLGEKSFKIEYDSYKPENNFTGLIKGSK